MKKILILCLLLFGCNKNSTSVSNEIDVDWVLINVSELIIEEDGVPFNGYMLFVTNSSGILGDDVTIDDNGLLTFTYNENNYSYDISDSYYEEGDIYTCEIYTENSNRIILNTELNYIMYFMGEGDGGNFNLSSPNILIDYR